MSRLRSLTSKAFVDPPAGIAVPKRVEGADWQPPYVGSDRMKVLVNGEPLTGCYAASVAGGWAKYVAAGFDSKERLVERDTVHGVVTLVQGDRY